MVGDVPIPFGFSALMLLIDFQVIENKNGTVDSSQGEIT